MKFINKFEDIIVGDNVVIAYITNLDEECPIRFHLKVKEISDDKIVDNEWLTLRLIDGSWCLRNSPVKLINIERLN